MKLNIQKRIAAKAIGVSPKRVKILHEHAEDLKDAITKQDLRGLVRQGVILVTQKKGVSRARANKTKRQKAKGLRKGAGSRKGKQGTHTPTKLTWMRGVRAQRVFLKELKEKKLIDTPTFTSLYKKSKGGFFRSVKHIKLYIDEHRLVKKE
jgi:large subunit ribosomal protein L19e